MAPHDFVLPVDKPEGPTSHDIVRVARRAFDERRIGHTGTLDPFASGLLILCVGKATRLAEYLGGLDKSYDAVARLGITTDTLDRDGAVTAERGGWEALDPDRIEQAFAGFRGEIEQVPPQYSAKKVGGVPAHRRVRRGESVELAPSRVRIHSLELTSLELPMITFRVRCSTGTYVRSLAADIGEGLGVGAHLVSLRRTSVGSLTVERAVPLAALDDSGAVAATALTPLQALDHLPRFAVDADAAGRIVHGRSVPLDSGAPHAGPIAVCHDGALLAVADVKEGAIHPRKVFAE